MTNREKLKAIINDLTSNGGVLQEQWDTILLTSIADSLAVIADTLTDRKDNKNENLKESAKAISEYCRSQENCNKCIFWNKVAETCKIKCGPAEYWFAEGEDD